ncbi:Integrin-linked protein kinase-like protein pat-4 [Diplonema papillatum]|nr:Integrin-linked protein kinase-like protein pat-4 [Diplonema papillatum]
MSILGFSSCWRRRGIVELHMACFRGHDGVVAVLLGHGADADRAGKLLWTPLHYACYWRRRGIVEALLEHGACPNKRNAQGSTPLHVASKDPGLAALLLESDQAEGRKKAAPGPGT